MPWATGYARKQNHQRNVGKVGRSVATMSENCAGSCASVIPVFHNQHSIDDDVWNPLSELLGALPRRRGLDGVGIEDRNVRFHAILQNAAFSKAQSLSGERGHLAYGPQCAGKHVAREFAASASTTDLL